MTARSKLRILLVVALAAGGIAGSGCKKRSASSTPSDAGAASPATETAFGVVIVPSAARPAGPQTGRWSMGTWARGLARLTAREATATIPTVALLKTVYDGDALSFAMADLPLMKSGVEKVHATYRRHYVVSMHVAIEDRIIDLTQVVWKADTPLPVLSRRYPWKLDDLGGMLDDVLDDLLRVTAGPRRGAATARGSRLWSKATKPEALEAFLGALDLQTLRAAARGRPLAGFPRTQASLLQEALTADPGFKPAMDMLRDPDLKFDSVVVAERQGGPVAARKP